MKFKSICSKDALRLSKNTGSGTYGSICSRLGCSSLYYVLKWSAVQANNAEGRHPWAMVRFKNRSVLLWQVINITGY